MQFYIFPATRCRGTINKRIFFSMAPTVQKAAGTVAIVTYNRGFLATQCHGHNQRENPRNFFFDGPDGAEGGGDYGNSNVQPRFSSKTLSLTEF